MGINDRPTPFQGRTDLETLMASPFDRVRSIRAAALPLPRARTRSHSSRSHTHARARARLQDWIKISEMLLGPVPPGFQFQPKHKANSYSTAVAPSPSGAVSVSNG